MPLPSEAVVRGWLTDLFRPAVASRRSRLVDRLRDNPYLDLLFPALFELDGFGRELAGKTWDARTGAWGTNPEFPGAVVALVAEDRLDRTTVLDATVRRLLHGDSVAALRPFVMLHDGLQPTVPELAARADDYARILMTAPSAVATLAQRALRAVDDAALLPLDTLLEVSGPVLARPEKSLVKSQLSWLDKVAHRSGTRAGELTATAMAAFTHPALDIQDHAVTVIERHVAHLDPTTAVVLSEVAHTLGADLPARITRLSAASGPAAASSTPDSGPILVPRGVAPTPPRPSGSPTCSAPERAVVTPTVASAPTGSALSVAFAPMVGAVASAGVGPLVGAAAPVAVMPAPIGSVVELAEEIGALPYQETAVRWERIVAALVAVRPTDDVAVLRTVVGRVGADFERVVWPPRPHFTSLYAAMCHLIGRPVDVERITGETPLLRTAPDRLLALRVAEVAAALSGTGTPTSADSVTPAGDEAHTMDGDGDGDGDGGSGSGSGSGDQNAGRGYDGAGGADSSVGGDGSGDEAAARNGGSGVVTSGTRRRQDRPGTVAGVPVLMATPTLANGSLDAGTLVARLRRAEAEGWEPLPLDLEQALLRLPRGTDPAVTDGLTTAAGRRLADWLAGDGLTDPVGVRVGQTADREGSGGVARIVVSLVPARAGRLSVEEPLVTYDRFPVRAFDRGRWVLNAEVLLATLPHHREVSAAWLLSGIAAQADEDRRGGGEILPRLAECSGPIGPAMSLALAYGLSARDDADRVAAVDAFLALAASGDSRTPAGEPFTVAVGRDLAELANGGMVKLNRTVLALADAHHGGASQAVGELVFAMLPLVLRPAPQEASDPTVPAPAQRGLADLLELGSQVAGAIGVRAEIPGLAVVAQRRGSSRLVKEARRLQAMLTR
ncbi:DUF6493 family protein [Actinoplanes sp. NPDC051851]|uniref:DUF6493 family protein n=1 Tax=Actinoplanes sp. NPDC051851 TaxID=3154753 RepID=UPI003444DFF1